VGPALREAAGVLRQAGCATPLLDAEVLLCHVTGLGRESLLAHPERRLTPRERRAYREAVGRRAARCPVAYITGRREFMSLDLEVGPGVLVPRPETELLVEVAAAAAREAGALLVADVGTGSGAVVVALARLLPECRFFASDSSPRALEYAARNIARYGLQGRVELCRGDLLEAFAPAASGRHSGPASGRHSGPASGRHSGPASGRHSGPASGRRLLDGVVANLPYVAEAEWPGLPPEVRLYEPPESLLGGPDGLDLFRRLASQLPAHLAPGGFVCLEVGAGQADAVTALLMGTGLFDSVRVHLDLGGRPRVLSARRVPTGPAAGPGRDSPLGVGQQLGRDRRREGPAVRSPPEGDHVSQGP
jgi:release factor glutamine methyltransferase